MDLNNKLNNISATDWYTKSLTDPTGALYLIGIRIFWVGDDEQCTLPAGLWGEQWEPCNMQGLSRGTGIQHEYLCVINTVTDQYTAPSLSPSDTMHIYLPASISSPHQPDYITLNKALVYGRLMLGLYWCIDLIGLLIQLKWKKIVQSGMSHREIPNSMRKVYCQLPWVPWPYTVISW